MNNAISPRRRARGFTLIEMLVVIAIIAVLSAILFPVFARVREGGRTAACSSNMKQLGLAFIQYSSDHGGRLPGAGNWQAWANGGHWVKGVNGAPGQLADLSADASGEFPPKNVKADVQGGALFPYVKSADVYKCPSNKDGDIKALTYSMNCALAGAPSNRVRFPSSMVLMVDEWRASDGYFWAVNDGESTDSITKDHNASGNLLFLDGHVKSYTNAAFPLGSNKAPDPNTTQNIANKWAGSIRGGGTNNEPASTDTPRLHDVTLGPKGSTAPAPFGDAGFDSCGQSTTTTP